MNLYQCHFHHVNFSQTFFDNFLIEFLYILFWLLLFHIAGVGGGGHIFNASVSQSLFLRLGELWYEG